MRAAAFVGFGGPDDVEVREFDDPTPRAGEAVVRVEAAALNRHDLWILEGDSAMVDEGGLPFVSGLDLAGVVDAVGDGVERVEPGQRVVLCPNQTCGVCPFCREGPENLCGAFGLYHGAFAERARVDADRLVALPGDVEFTEAAAIPTAYMTAWHMLRRADAAPGDLVFVPGATGGVGVAAVQLVDVIGARTIGTSASTRKLERVAALGCDHTVQAGDPETIRRAVAEIGEPDAVINHLGGEYTRMGQEVMRRGGTMVVCGRTAGSTSRIDVPDLFLAHKRVVGSTMGTQGDLEALVGLVADGEFEPVVDREYPLEETGTAFVDMQERDAVGKLVVRP